MNVLVVGSGAQGCWLGSRLLQAGIGVSFLVGSRQRADELDRHGMVVRSPGGFFQCRVRAITHGEISQHFDVVILATRANKGSIALSAAREAIRSSTVVLPLHFDPIQMSLLVESDLGIPVACAPTLDVSQFRDGSVNHAGARTSLSIGSLGTANTGIDIVQKLFIHSEVAIEVSSDIRSEMWVSFATSAVGAALDILFPFNAVAHWNHPEETLHFTKSCERRFAMRA